MLSKLNIAQTAADPVAAKRTYQILISPDFGMDPKGKAGNSKAFLKGDKVIVEDPFYMPSNRPLSKVEKDWQPNGTYEIYFREDYNIQLTLVSATVVHDEQKYPGMGGYNQFTLTAKML